MNLNDWSDVITITLGIGAVSGFAYKATILGNKIITHLGVHSKMATASMLRLTKLEKSVEDLSEQLVQVEKAVQEHVGARDA
jgi:hypothetical protein